jgi:hypothetical protein
MYLSLGMVPPSSGRFTGANDNMALAVERKLRSKKKANHGKKPNCGRG